MTGPLRVLFVCTANISRSPYAEQRLRALLPDRPIEVSSAGVLAREGDGMDDAMRGQLSLRAGESAVNADHRSRPVTADAMADADLVLTFEFGQHMRLLDAWPGHAGKVFGVQQFVAGLRELPTRWASSEPIADVAALVPPDSVTLDVADPYRRGAKVAAACADEIDGAVAALAPFLESAVVGRALRTRAVVASTASTPGVAPRERSTALGSGAAGGPARPGAVAGGAVIVGAAILLAGVVALVASGVGSTPWWAGWGAVAAGGAAALVGAWRLRAGSPIGADAAAPIAHRRSAAASIDRRRSAAPPRRAVPPAP